MIKYTNYYSVLNLNSSATNDDIEKAYRAKKTSVSAEDPIVERAYFVLKSKGLKTKYDKLIGYLDKINSEDYYSLLDLSKQSASVDIENAVEQHKTKILGLRNTLNNSAETSLIDGAVEAIEKLRPILDMYPNITSDDFYKRLGCKKDDTKEKLSESYSTLIVKFTNSGSKTALDKLKEAYQLLSSQESRLLYDRLQSDNFYERLGVDRNATQESITKAYRDLSRKTHPDTLGTNLLFLKLKESYDTLRDVSKRLAHNTMLDQNSIYSPTATQNSHSAVKTEYYDAKKQQEFFNKTELDELIGLVEQITEFKNSGKANEIREINNKTYILWWKKNQHLSEKLFQHAQILKNYLVDENITQDNNSDLFLELNKNNLKSILKACKDALPHVKQKITDAQALIHETMSDVPEDKYQCTEKPFNLFISKTRLQSFITELVDLYKTCNDDTLSLQLDSIENNKSLNILEKTQQILQTTEVYKKKIIGLEQLIIDNFPEIESNSYRSNVDINCIDPFGLGFHTSKLHNSIPDIKEYFYTRFENIELRNQMNTVASQNVTFYQQIEQIITLAKNYEKRYCIENKISETINIVEKNFPDCMPLLKNINRTAATFQDIFKAVKTLKPILDELKYKYAYTSPYVSNPELQQKIRDISSDDSLTSQFSNLATAVTIFEDAYKREQIQQLNEIYCYFNSEDFTIDSQLSFSKFLETAKKANDSLRQSLVNKVANNRSFLKSNETMYSTFNDKQLHELCLRIDARVKLNLLQKKYPAKKELFDRQMQIVNEVGANKMSIDDLSRYISVIEGAMIEFCV